MEPGDRFILIAAGRTKARGVWASYVHGLPQGGTLYSFGVVLFAITGIGNHDQEALTMKP